MDVFRHLFARLKGPARVVPTAQSVTLAERILSEKRYSTGLTEIISGKSLFERWEVVNALLFLKPNPAFHFLHVPKTGGTTFGETLSKDQKAVILSVDASPDTLTKQMIRFANADEERLALIRAHHSLALVHNSGCYKRFKLTLTAFRSPAHIHISNVNMIMRRVQGYQTGETQPAAEREFSEEWLSSLRQPFEYSTEYARQLLTSDGYRRKMGGVYGRFFNTRDWQSLVKNHHLLVIDAENFDVLLTRGFGYHITPARLNVSVQPLLNSSDISEHDIEPLIAPDQEIATFLQQHLSEPESIIAHLFDSKRQVNTG